MKSIKDRLYLSTIADDDYEQAEAYGVGLEIAEFCTATNLEGELFDIFDSNARIKMKSADRFLFHGPFAELSPCCIDPRVRQVSMERYLQAIRLAETYGIKRVVLHSGFIPQVYFPHWYKEESAKFWPELLEQIPADTEILLENVMDPDPDLLCSVVKRVNDPRLRLCLDVGHANITACPMDRWLEKFKPFLHHVHLHNNDGVTDTHDSLGCGSLDMEKLLDWLNENVPQATITLEHMNDYDSMQWLEPRGYL